MFSQERSNIPFLARLIPDGIKPPRVFLVEYDPESQWLAVAVTAAALYVQAGSRVSYSVMLRPRDAAIADLERLGVDVSACEEAGLLRVDDWYQATLGREHETMTTEAVDDKYTRTGSLKIADLSVDFLKRLKGKTELTKWSSQQHGVLTIAESFSSLLRFNDEKVFLEWMEGRNLPLQRQLGRINLLAIARRLHSESFYARMENASDGVVDIKIIEVGDETKNFLRVRSLKGHPHDTRWHEIEIKPNGEATLIT